MDHQPNDLGAAATVAPVSAPPSTMRAVQHLRYGDAGVLQLAERDVPRPGRGQVLVRVRAAAIDRGTWHVMRGEPWLARLAFGLRRPSRVPVPGRDVAGTVVAVGDGVTRFAVGDEVYGTALGSLAEYAVAPVVRLAPAPSGVAAATLAPIPVSGLTAWQALRDGGRLQPGHRVLVIGASGGVGSFAVQLAHACGAEVVGVCSASKADAVRALGADRVIDRRVPAWWRPLLDADERFDVVLDGGGRLPVRTLRRLVAPRGALVLVGAEGGGPVTGGMGRQLRAVLRGLVSRQRIVMLVARESGADLEGLNGFVERGQLSPYVDRVVDLDGVVDAMRALERGEVTGKIVVVP